MIHESYPWKRDLLQRKRLIQKYNRLELLEKEDDKAYTILEKSIFSSAFIIRKLVDCKGKVSDDVDQYTFRLKKIVPQKNIDLLHHWPNEKSHNWGHEEICTALGKDICNWLIHSFVFVLYYDSEKAESFGVSSDYDRNKNLYIVSIDDWTKYMEFVGTDYVVAVNMHYDKNKNNYIFTKKERG